MYNPWASGVRAGAGFHFGRRLRCMLRRVPMAPPARSRAMSASSTATPSPRRHAASASKASTRPRSAQTCQRKWFGSWPCGTAATAALTNMIGGRPVTCDAAGLDKYGRTLGRLLRRRPRYQRADGAPGLRLGLRQILHELREGGGGCASARASASGRARPMPAWEFRAKPLGRGRAAGAGGLRHQGQRHQHGRIYHMPWSPWYAQIKMRGGQGQALVLHGGRGDRRRLAAGGGALGGVWHRTDWLSYRGLSPVSIHPRTPQSVGIKPRMTD